MKDEAGFTMMETLTVIALSIIIAGAMGALLFSSWRITNGIRQRNMQQFRQMRIENLIREAAEGVSVPYWQQPEQGLPKAKSAIGKALANAGYKNSFELETLHDNSGRPRGVICRCHIDGREYEVQSLFASVPPGGSYK